jgi:ATP-dependent RNA helicase DeaD
MTFQEIGLNQDLLRAVSDLGFETPTPIQQQTVPALSQQKTDLVALAQTGTGKTAAFGLPALSKIDLSNRQVQVLVLAPTRELCVQITNDLRNFGKYMPGFSICAIYGGASLENQARDIRKGVHVIAATPGRLIDMIERGVVKLQTIKIVVLDEADEMLNMGFKDDLDTILSETPDEKNVWLFSATMPKEVERIARNYMHAPMELTAGRKNEGAENLEHIYYLVHSRDRYAALKRVADYYPDIFGIVFCRTKAETQEVADLLIKDGYNADALHGDLSQSQRDFVMRRFRSRTLQMLVATDVAARGIDVNDVTHVINYNLPEDVEIYTHRTGRTARAGKSGIAITIVTPKDQSKIKDIERIIKKNFEKRDVPNGLEVCEKQLFNLVHKINQVEVRDEEIESFLPAIYDELKDLSKEELIKKVVSEEFNRFHDYYLNAPDLNINNGVDGAFGKHRTSRFFLNMGRLDGFNLHSMRDFLCDLTKLHSRMVFNIDIKNSFSFFETETRYTDNFLNLTKENIEFNGRKLELELSQKKMRESSGGGKKGGRERKEFSGDGERRGRRDGDFKRNKSQSGGGFREGKPQGGGGFRDRERSGRKKSFGKSSF